MQEFINIVKYEHIHALIQQRRFQEATALLEILIQFQPDHPRWYELRLIIASQNSKVDEYLIWYALIQEQFPDSSTAWLAKGLYPGVKIQTARDALLTAAKLDPENPYLFYFLAKTYRYLGNYRLALKNANRCLALDPLFYLVLLERIDCYGHLGNMTEQITDAFAAICYLDGMNKNHLFKKILDEFTRYINSSKKLPPGKTDD
jgi:tetratricopeptide (TPR) repeat protein